MKKFNSILKILVCLLLCISFLFQSCSNEIPSYESLNDVETLSSLQARTPVDLPNNPANSFDYVGQLHNILLYSYYEQPPLIQNFSSVMKRLDSIALNSVEFNQFSSGAHILPDSMKVNSILTQKIVSATAIISRSGLSVPAKSSLSTFISSVLDFSLHEEDYEVVYSFIVDYELDVMHDSVFNTKDKEILLSISSIARHSSYVKKKRPKKNMDPDWDVLVSNIIGSVEGASENQATAIMYGLVSGILENR